MTPGRSQRASRRTALRLVGAALAAGFAGCATTGDEETPTLKGRPTTRRGSGKETGTATDTETPTESETETETDTPDSGSAAGRWPTYQFDARNSGSRPDGQAVTPRPTESWAYHTGEALIDVSPVVGNDMVYLASGHRPGVVYALDAATGEERWTVELDTVLFRNSPALVDGTVYVGTVDEKLYALDAETGERRWTREIGLGGTSPTVVDDVLFVTGAGTLHALDRRTGEDLWQFRRFEDGLSGTTPAITDEVVYYVASSETNQRRLVAIERSSRSPRWESGTDRNVLPWVAPTVGDGVVYVADHVDGPSLVAFDATSGEIHWEADHFRAGLYDSPALADRTLYVGSSDDNLYAVDAETGEKRWAFETGRAIGNSPAVAGGTVVFGSHDGSVYAVDVASGEKRWQFETGYPIRSSPAVVDGTVYVGSDDGRIYALGE